MRSSVGPGLLTFVLTGSGVVGVGAINLQSSERARTLLQLVASNCPGSSGLSFGFTLSDTVEDAMIAESQQVAPMVRPMGPAICSAPAVDQAQSWVVALDAVEPIASQNGSSCTGGFRNSGTIELSTGTYAFEDWRDVLRVLYAGMDHGAGSSYENRDCGSELRRVIAANYSAAFQTPCTSGICPAGIRHLWRREDASDTTRMLVDLLRLPPIETSQYKTPFCNALVPTSSPLGRNHSWDTVGDHGHAPPFVTVRGVTYQTANVYAPDYQDFDPIRRPCAGTNDAGSAENATAASEQVCDLFGELGLVLTILPPLGLASNAAFPTEECAPGRTRAMVAPTPLNFVTGWSGGGVCPNGVFTHNGTCPTPVSTLGLPCFAGQHDIPAVLGPDNVAVPATYGSSLADTRPTSADGRAYNTVLRQGSWLGRFQADPWGRSITGAYYRVHSTRSLEEPDATKSSCRFLEASLQIGCLVQASPCSIGMAGVNATRAGGIAFPVDGVWPSATTIGNAISHAGPMYPLGYPIMANSIIGPFAMSSQQLSQYNLWSCLVDSSIVSAAASSAGLLPLGQAPFCVDFDEETECGAEKNNNSCGGLTFNLCPTITNTTIVPTQVDQGSSMDLIATANDRDGSPNPLTFQWTVSPPELGTFAAPSDPETKFTCEAAGAGVITLSVADGECSASSSALPIRCGS